MKVKDAPEIDSGERGDVKVSIIIPALKKNEQLEKTIKSALNQDFPKEDYEIILVSQANPSLSRLAKEYGIRYAFVKEKDIGKAIKHAISKAKGEPYICEKPMKLHDLTGFLKDIAEFDKEMERAEKVEVKPEVKPEVVSDKEIKSEKVLSPDIPEEVKPDKSTKEATWFYCPVCKDCFKIVEQHLHKH